MIVLVAGMPRSGSTFSFNVARELLQARGPVYQEASNDLMGAMRRSDGAEHVLVKAHTLNRASLRFASTNAVRIIMTVRRVEDAMASWFATFDAVPEDVSVKIMREWLRLFHQLRPHSLVIPYETIDLDPTLATWRIAGAICPTADTAEVSKIARRFSKAAVKRHADTINADRPGVRNVGFSHFDAAAVFHRRHVSDLQSRPAEQRLSEDQLVRVREALAADVDAAGLEEFREWILPHQGPGDFKEHPADRA